MSMGIEQFRSVATKDHLENRRITIEGQGQNKEIRAPNNLWGRFVDWVKGSNQTEQTQNKTARRTFFEALEKAYGRPIADRALENTVGLDGQGFKFEGTKLTAKTVKQVLDSAHKEYLQCLGQNNKNAYDYVESKRLVTTAFNQREKHGHYGLPTNDQDLVQTFFQLIGAHPDYGKRVFRDEELDLFARKAVEVCCDIKKARFDEQHPHLARVENDHFHDSQTYFDDFKQSLDAPPLAPLNVGGTGMGGSQGKQWFEKSLDGIQESTQLLGTMKFDVNGAKALREEVKNQITELRSRLIEQQQSVVEKGFQGVCGQFAGNAMQTALKEALRGCTQDLTPNEDDLIDDPQVDDGVPLDNVEDPNLRRNFDLIDEPLVERVEKEKPKKGVKWKDEVTDEPLTKTDYFEGPPDDGNVKKHSQTTKSQVRKLEDSVEDLFVNKFLQSSLSDLVGAKPPRFLTNPEERKELTLKMAGKFDDYLMRHGVSENERKERVDTFVQVFGETINREGSDEIPGMGKISQCVESARPLQESIVDELGNQIGKLMSKLQYLDDYIGADPLSEKAIAHDRLVWAQTTVTALDDLIANLTGQLPENTPRENLTREQRRIFDAREAAIARRDLETARVEQAQTEFDNASPERPPGIDSDSARRIAYTNRRREFVRMKLFLDQIGMHLGRGVDGKRETTGAFLDRMRVKTLETMEQWQPIVRDMNVSRDGVDRLYRSEIVPGSRIGGAVGRSYQEHGVKGLAPGDRVNTQHAPNLQVSYLSRVEKSENGDEVKTGLLKTIRHGVLDVFGIPNEQTRKEASKAGAKEVLTASVEINDDFKQRALEKHDLGNQPSSKIVHINIGLLPGELSSKQRERRDGEFIQHQFDAFNELPDENGKVMLPVVNEQNIERNVEFEVDTISFAFGTPKDKDEAKRFEEHDRQSMIKLFGDAMPGTTMGGYMGGLVDRLTRLSRQEDTSPEQKQAITKLLAKIRGEVDTVRSEFTSGLYKTSDEDRHRMARHVMRVVDLGAEALRLLGDNDTLMSLSEGCRDNLDSGSMVDVEHKTQAIIEDFGGLVIPGTLSEQDQTIYNTVLTSSGQVEMQTMTTGLGGTGSVDEVSDRSNDPKALEYARGFGSEHRV